MKNAFVKVFVSNGDFSADVKRFKDAGIDIYALKPVKNGCMVTVDELSRHKFFAICKNMCYNIKIIGCSGLLAPIYNAVKHVGAVIGVVALFALNFAFSDVITGIEKIGDGKNLAVISKEAENVGVKAGGRFSKLDYARATSLILSDNPSLSFVTLKKDGNRLIINAVKATVGVAPIDKDEKDLIAGVGGVVKSITVLRGTPTVKAGDKVNAGDVLAGAYLLDKDGKSYPAYLIATVEIESEQEYFYKKENPSEKDFPYAKSAARFMADGEATDVSCEIAVGGVMVKAKVTHTFIAG